MTQAKDFVAVNRTILTNILDAVLARKGDDDWTRDAARKMVFGLVHGQGTADDLVRQAKDEAIDACIRIAEEGDTTRLDTILDRMAALKGSPSSGEAGSK